MKIGVGALDQMLYNLKIGQKITAVKLVRDKCGADLREAKEFVEMFSDEQTRINHSAVVEIILPRALRNLVIDEETIFDPDLAAECPIDRASFKEEERETIVERVIQRVLDQIRGNVRCEIKEALYRRFMNQPDGERDLMMEMLNDKFFHI